MMTPLPAGTLRRFGSLIERGLGQVPQEALVQGWQRLSRRLAPEERATSRILLSSRRTWAKPATIWGPH
jgi:hypothetical protein